MLSWEKIWGMRWGGGGGYGLGSKRYFFDELLYIFLIFSFGGATTAIGPKCAEELEKFGGNSLHKKKIKKILFRN